MAKTPSLAKGIFLRGSVYWLRFSLDGKQKFVSLQTSDPVEAVRRMPLVKGAPELNQRTGLEADIDRFILAKKAAGSFTSDATEKWARRGLAHLVRYLPGKTAATVTSGDMQRFLAHLLTAQAETGAMSYLRGIKSFFSWTVEQRIRFENPCKKLVRQPKEPARKKFATKRQRDAVITRCYLQRLRGDEDYHEPLHFALFCALHAGMRFNEIIQARPDWFHLDAPNPYISIQRTHTFTPKNRTNRTVPLTAAFVHFLRVYGLREPFMMAPEVVQGSTEYRYDFRAPWNEHVAACGVAWLTPHNARRTFASLLVQSGTPIYKVAKWMGHGVLVCERHYAHLAPGDSGIEAMI